MIMDGIYKVGSMVAYPAFLTHLRRSTCCKRFDNWHIPMQDVTTVAGNLCRESYRGVLLVLRSCSSLPYDFLRLISLFIDILLWEQLFCVLNLLAVVTLQFISLNLIAFHHPSSQSKLISLDEPLPVPAQFSDAKVSLPQSSDSDCACEAFLLSLFKSLLGPTRRAISQPRPMVHSRRFSCNT